jgi:hypothetical protein
LTINWLQKVRTKRQKVRVKYSNRYTQMPKANGYFEAG